MRDRLITPTRIAAMGVRMLHVAYEASLDLAPGKTARIREYRGGLTVHIARGAPIEEWTEALNAELKAFLARCTWFQIWRGRILSAASPEGPLTVEYVIDDKLARPKILEVRESRGRVTVHVAATATVDDFVRVINPTTVDFLAGRQWFQLWEGEIITMDSPPDARAA